MKNEPQLGRLIEGNEQRDAIHIAIAPVVAGERLKPGQHIGLKHSELRQDLNGEWIKTMFAGDSKKPIGIVDPFLRGVVLPGQKFFMLLYPQTITSLKHLWEHPAFDGKSE